MVSIFFLVAGVLLSVVFALMWLFHRDQTTLARSPGNAIRICFRILILHAIAFAIGHFLGGLSLRSMAIVVFAAPLVVVCLHQISWGDMGGDIIGFALIVPAYLLKHFVLGLALSHDLDLEQIDESLVKPVPKPDHSYVSRTGFVCATLRPLGEIRIGDLTLSAKSHDGGMIDVDTPVVVTGVSGNTQIVKRLDA